MKTLVPALALCLVLRGIVAPTQAQVFDKSEKGFVDAEFSAQSIEDTAGGDVCVTAVAHAGADEVGFQVVIPRRWDPWKPKNLDADWYRGVVVVRNFRADTEALVRVLANAYGKAAPAFAFTEIHLTAISLGGDPRKVRTEPVKLKLFRESESEKEYAEIYLNFDLPKRLVELREKDPEYRSAVLRFLSEGSANHRLEAMPAQRPPATPGANSGAPQR